MFVSPGNEDRCIHDLVQWLKGEAPSFVRKIVVDEVLHQNEQPQQLMPGHDLSVSKSLSVQSLDQAGQQEILDVWQEVNSLFAEILQSWTPIGGRRNSHGKVSQLKEKILQFVQELDPQTSSVIRRLEVELPPLSSTQSTDHLASLRCENCDILISPKPRGPGMGLPRYTEKLFNPIFWCPNLNCWQSFRSLDLLREHEISHHSDGSNLENPFYNDCMVSMNMEMTAPNTNHVEYLFEGPFSRFIRHEEV